MNKYISPIVTPTENSIHCQAPRILIKKIFLCAQGIKKRKRKGFWGSQVLAAPMEERLVMGWLAFFKLFNWKKKKKGIELSKSIDLTIKVKLSICKNKIKYCFKWICTAWLCTSQNCPYNPSRPILRILLSRMIKSIENTEVGFTLPNRLYITQLLCKLLWK